MSNPQDEMRWHADYGYVHLSEVKRRDERSAKAGRITNLSLGISAAIFFILSMGAFFTDHIGLSLAFATLCALAAPINWCRAPPKEGA